MTLLLNGTNGVSDVDGSASTPAVRGTDTNTGIFFPAADTIAFAEGGAEVARFDSNGNLGIGTSSPAQVVEAVSTNAYFRGRSSGGAFTGVDFGQNSAGDAIIYNRDSSKNIIFYNNAAERMRIDSSGNLLIGATNTNQSFKGCRIFSTANGVYSEIGATGTSSWDFFNFYRGTDGSLSRVGYIRTDGSSTSYVTSSDYRLKENVTPMTGALAKVSALKPVTYTWKSTGEASQGFIAHELQEVVPDCVTGEKDAVDAEGNPQYQGIDTSFLVATLTASIQELKAIVDAQAERISVLENNNVGN